MLDGFLPELEVVDANHSNEAYQIICHRKKSCAHKVLIPCPQQIHQDVEGWACVWDGLQFRVQARRFFCDDSACSTSIFTERFSSVCRPHSRRTIRLERSLLRVLSGMSAIGLEHIWTTSATVRYSECWNDRNIMWKNLLLALSALMTGPGENEKIWDNHLRS